MKKSLPLIVLGLFLALIGFRIYQEVSPSSASAGADPASSSRNRPAMLVEVARPEPRIFESTVEALGELQPLRQVTVMPRANGYLRTITVDRADPVRLGQLIAEIEDAHLANQMARAEAAISVARAALKREEAGLRSLELQVERMRQLHAEELISRQDREESEARLSASEAQVELSRAQVAQAEASLRELRVQQELTKVYSPMDGIVAERLVDPGALVNPSTGLALLVDVRRLKLVVSVPEGALSGVRAGLESAVTVDALPAESIRGTITRVSPIVRSDTRSADVEVEIPNPSARLAPGMFARVRIAAGDSGHALSIPRAALLTRAEQQGVFLLAPGPSAVFRAISVGRIDDNRVEVRSGLEPHDVVITTGAHSLNDGDRVRLPDEAAGGESPH